MYLLPLMNLTMSCNFIFLFLYICTFCTDEELNKLKLRESKTIERNFVCLRRDIMSYYQRKERQFRLSRAPKKVPIYIILFQMSYLNEVCKFYYNISTGIYGFPFCLIFYWYISSQEKAKLSLALVKI